MRTGHLLPVLALACAAASGWLAVPLEVALVAAAMATGPARRPPLAFAAAGVALAAAPLGAPLGVAPETLAELGRLLDAFGPAGAGAAALSPQPLRAVAAAAEGSAWAGVGAGVVVRCAALVGVGALLERVPVAAWRRLGWAATASLGALVASWGLA